MIVVNHGDQISLERMIQKTSFFKSDAKVQLKFLREACGRFDEAYWTRYWAESKQTLVATMAEVGLPPALSTLVGSYQAEQHTLIYFYEAAGVTLPSDPNDPRWGMPLDEQTMLTLAAADQVVPFKFVIFECPDGELRTVTILFTT